MLCPSCQAENRSSAPRCVRCAQGLDLVLARGTVIASRYEIAAPLGRGGMSVVFEAYDRVRKETVALKVLRPELGALPEMERRFACEIPMAARIRQQNVCHVFDCGAEGDLRFIAMERVRGEDLAALLAREGALPRDRAFDVAIQLGHGIQALHVAGIVHRDVKPKNVMCGEDGRVRIMDFDIARQCHSRDPEDDTVFGTPEYASPEQVCGDAADYRADIYSLGVVTFELFTGRVPFRGITSVETVRLHVTAPPPLEGPGSEGLPLPVVPVLRRTLAKDPGERYTTARAVVEALRLARSMTLPGGEVPRRSPAPAVSPTSSTPLRKRSAAVEPPPPTASDRRPRG
jgi:serine/threonine protein kinase